MIHCLASDNDLSVPDSPCDLQRCIPLLKKLAISAAVLMVISAFLVIRYLNRPEGSSSLSGDVSTQAPVIVSTTDAEQWPAQDAESDLALHPLDPVLDIARDILSDLRANVRDYTATMIKRERMGGRLGDESKMELKLRCRVDGQSPSTLAVYLRFLEPASAAGREVIWSEGLRDGKLIAHEGGFKNWTRLTLDPTGMLAMVGNKYPITDIGMRRLAEKLIEKGMEDRQQGTCIVQTIPDQRVGDRSCTLYQIVHPEPGEGFDFHIAQIFVDSQRNIPLRYAAFLWPEDPDQPPPLEEEITFLNVKLNVGLAERDFDPDNPDYNYP